MEQLVDLIAPEWLARRVLRGGAMRAAPWFLVVMSFLGCGRELGLSLEVTPAGSIVMPTIAPPPDGGPGCGNLPFGPDCCEAGRRVGSATCVAGAQVCTTGELCTCAGVPQAFQCAEYCGSDAFAAPECVNGQWRCARPTSPTSSCGPDVCWGDPGECCGAPSCVDGGWVCAFRPSGCG